MLCGILFVLYTGIHWEFLPQELGYGSGMTCWRRLRDWNEAGVWRRLHELLLAELRAANLPGTAPNTAPASASIGRKRPRNLVIFMGGVRVGYPTGTTFRDLLVAGRLGVGSG